MMEIVSAKIERVHTAGSSARTLMEEMEKESLIAGDEKWTALKKHVHDILDAVEYFETVDDDGSQS